MGDELLKVTFDKRALASIQRRMKAVPQKIPVVMSRALNKTMTTAKTAAAREIASEVAIKVTTAKKSMTITKATRFAWVTTAILSGRRIPLIEFAAKQTKKKGVSYKIKKGGKRERRPRAFIRTMRSGHKGVFRRKPRFSRAGLFPRLPIQELRGPSVKEVFSKTAGLIAGVMEKARVTLKKEIERQVNLILKR